MKNETKRNAYLYEVVQVRSDALGVVEEYPIYQGPSRRDAQEVFRGSKPYAVIDERNGLELRAWVVSGAGPRIIYWRLRRLYRGNWLDKQTIINMADGDDDDKCDGLMNAIYAGPGYDVLKREGAKNEKIHD